MKATAVVIVCCNLGHTLGEAVASVLDQTRPAAELLVSDDGSDDPFTRRALAAMAASGVAISRAERQGPAAARNRGIELTHAPYVLLLDADDILEPACIEAMSETLASQPDLDFVSCGLRAFGDAAYDWYPEVGAISSTLARGGPHISTMFRRALWHRVGGFDGTLAGYEDLHFWLSALRLGMRGTVLDRILLRYRVRPDSRYRRALVPHVYVETMARLYARHDVLDSTPVPLLMEKERFLVEQRAHGGEMSAQRSSCLEEIARLRAELSALGGQLAAAEVPALEWGRFGPTLPTPIVASAVDDLEDFYILEMLGRHRADIRGTILEVGSGDYAARAAGARPAGVDCILLRPSMAPEDLLTQVGLRASESVDCFILPHVVQYAFDPGPLFEAVFRVLKPGGVLLCTAPSVRRDGSSAGPIEYWRMTAASLRRLASVTFPPEQVDATSFGNVLICAAALAGLPPADLTDEQTHDVDPAFPFICGVRAVKPRPGMEASFVPGRVPAPSRGGVILAYHRIGSRTPDVHHLAVGQDIFEEHLHHLRREYSVLELGELVARARLGTLPVRAVAVTFDDGYLEHLTVVAPLASAHHVPATFFVLAERLDEEHECWWDLLERVFAPDAEIPALLDLHGDGRTRLKTATAIDRANTHRTLVESLYPAPSPVRDSIVRRVCDWSGLTLRPRPSHRVLTSAEVRQLAAMPGVTVGVHSVTHASLPHQAQDVKAHEVLEARRALEDCTGRTLTAFAYPYGAYDAATASIVSGAGFEVGCAIVPGVTGAACHRLAVPRHEVTSGNARDLVRDLERYFEAAAGSPN
jgi:peptidoglycan/xylan/chitin deacetylase (PgdA/CDA1 family)